MKNSIYWALWSGDSNIHTPIPHDGMGMIQIAQYLLHCQHSVTVWYNYVHVNALSALLAISGGHGILYYQCCYIKNYLVTTLYLVMS